MNNKREGGGGGGELKDRMALVLILSSAHSQHIAFSST